MLNAAEQASVEGMPATSQITVQWLYSRLDSVGAHAPLKKQ
jgi:hypothetical protein